MEQENQIKSTSTELIQQEQQLLINNIIRTYGGKTTLQVKEAEQQINKIINRDENWILFLFKFIKPPYQMPRSFRMACANIIKKYFYKISQSQQIDKEKYIKEVYETLSATNYEDYSIKQVLNIGLEYIFNSDTTMKYKTKWIRHVMNQIYALVQNPDGWTLQTLEVLHGLIIILISYLNSLIQPQDQINFVTQILNYLCLTANLCGQFARDNIEQSVSKKLLFLVQQKIFEFFQLATQRLLQQQDEVFQKIQSFKNSQRLVNIMLQYLYMFCQGQTLITKYPQLNTIKASILQILYIMDSYDTQINFAIIQLLYTTFVFQSNNRRDDNDDDYSEKIIYKTVCILGSHLDKKIHYEFFLRQKMEILFSLLMYSRTTPQQQSYLVDNPDKFVQIAEQYSECYVTSPLIKVKAAYFLRIFVKKIDEALCNLVQLCTIFIAGSIASQETDSDILKAAKEAFSKYNFFNLSPKEKLDTSFMVLTTIAPLVYKRSDMKTIILSLIITNFNVIIQVEDQLVRARLVRLVGYYCTSIYFSFIQKLMVQSRVYFLQGITTFQKIMKNTTYLETFPIMHIVYLGFIDIVSVTDSIFQRLVLQNYEKIMKKNDQLYQKCLQKILSYFIQSTQSMSQNSSKQHSILCLNYIQKMIKLQNQQKYLKVLGQYYLKMQQLGLKIDLLIDNFVSIYQTLISKHVIVAKPVQQFVLNFSAPHRLFNYQNCSEYFLLLNKYTLKSQNKEVMQQINKNLCDYLQESLNEGFNFGIIPPLSYCMGHIIISNSNINIDQKFFLYLVQIMLKKQKQQVHLSLYKPWYLFILLHFLYIKPAQMRQYLLANKMYYPLMVIFFTTKLTCKIQRKAAVLAAQSLINFELNQQLRIEIIKYCIIQLNHQKQRYKIKRKGYKGSSRRNVRRQNNFSVQNDEEGTKIVNQQEQAIQNDQLSKKDQDNIYFKDFKHSFDQICEFSMFKHRIQSLRAHLKQINEQNLPGLTSIMQYEWHMNTIRKVLRITK